MRPYTLPLHQAARGEERAESCEERAEVELRGGFGMGAWCALLNERERGSGEREAAALRSRLRRVLGGRAGERGREAEGARPIVLEELFGEDCADEGGSPSMHEEGRAAKRAKKEAILARKEAKKEAKMAKREATKGAAKEAAKEVSPADVVPAYRLEIGCGAGEWVAAQAAAAPHVRWLALELRRDRAQATAARMALARLTNLAVRGATRDTRRRDALEPSPPPFTPTQVLAGGAADALERWIAPCALEAIYVNHPEPPQQSATPQATPHSTRDGRRPVACTAGMGEAPEARGMLPEPQPQPRPSAEARP